MLGNPEKKHADRWCEFHQDKGHNTNDCYQLKKHIEEAVRSGQLRHLLTEIRSGPRQGGRNQGSNNRNDQKGKGKEVHMVARREEGSSRRRQRRPTVESWMRQEIVFPPLGKDSYSHEPVVVRGYLGRTPVSKVYVDTGSAIEIMYKHYFKKLERREQERLRKPETWLQGFLGNMSYPMGEIDLPLTMKDGYRSRTEVVTFSVIDAKSAYDVIIGRSGLSLFQAIPSTLHSLLKFPTPHGIATLQSEGSSRRASQEGEPRPQERRTGRALERRLIHTTHLQPRYDGRGHEKESPKTGKTLTSLAVKTDWGAVKKRSQNKEEKPSTKQMCRQTEEEDRNPRPLASIGMAEQIAYMYDPPKEEEKESPALALREEAGGRGRKNGTKGNDGRKKLKNLVLKLAPKSPTETFGSPEEENPTEWEETVPESPM